MQVDLGELLGHLVEQAGLGQTVDLSLELEVVEDVAHIGREALHVGEEAVCNVASIGHACDLRQVQWRLVVELVA